MIVFMEINDFEKLKNFYGSYKKTAEEIGISYTRYNQWRWDPSIMPKYARKLIELAVLNIKSNCEAA